MKDIQNQWAQNPIGFVHPLFKPIYISSGILELYCAGALSEAEMREVERMASQFAAVKKEIHRWPEEVIAG